MNRNNSVIRINVMFYLISINRITLASLQAIYVALGNHIWIFHLEIYSRTKHRPRGRQPEIIHFLESLPTKNTPIHKRLDTPTNLEICRKPKGVISKDENFRVVCKYCVNILIENNGIELCFSVALYHFLGESQSSGVVYYKITVLRCPNTQGRKRPDQVSWS